MHLIKNNQGKAGRCKLFRVPAQDTVGGHYNPACQRLLQVPPAAIIHGQGQIREIILLFFRPVVEHRSRTDNKKPVFFLSQQVNQGQGLVSFAQPHIIGQDAAQAIPVQLKEPECPMTLVGAEMRGQLTHLFSCRAVSCLQKFC